MKKILLFCTIFLGIQTNAMAANLLDVYAEALQSDPTYQQAISQRLANRENVPISLAGLLPNASANVTPTVSRTLSSGPATIPGENDAHGYTVALNLTQTIFDFGKFAGLAGSMDLAKEADATLSAATQELIIRVAKAYFTVLQDQDNLTYIASTRRAYQKQLDQAKQQYRVGLKTITDVYTAEASYQSSVASYIAAENTLESDRESLRAITGVLYPSLSTLSERFPLISPQPALIDEWVTLAGKQNWYIKAAQYNALSAHQNVRQQFAGHLPTLNAEGSYGIQFSRNTGPGTLVGAFRSGSLQIHTTTVGLSLNIPIVAGGQVIAQTDQAKYNYEVALQQLEYQLRQTLMVTRQSYLGVMSGISKIAADRQAIKSAISSLNGMEAGYRVGTEILVNVLNQQQAVFQAQQQYAADRYAYVNNLLALKQAAGTLNPDDLAAVNSWLENTRSDDSVQKPFKPKKTSVQSKHHRPDHHKKTLMKHPKKALGNNT